MSEHSEDQGRLTKVASAIFLHTEHAIYAALGINLFSTVKHQDLVNEQNNF